LVANIVDITFANDQAPGPGSGNPPVASVSGTIVVNYTTGAVSGSLTATDSLSSDTFSNFAFGYDPNLQGYDLVGEGDNDPAHNNLIIEYVGQQPTFASLIDIGLNGRYYVAWSSLSPTSQPPLSSTPDPTPQVAITSEVLASDTGTGTSTHYDRITSDGRVTLTGTASAVNGIAGVEIFNGTADLGAATVSGSDWSFSTTLAEGSYALRAVVSDMTGMSTGTSPAPAIVVDTTPPTATIAAQTLSRDSGTNQTDAITQFAWVTLTGSAADTNGGVSVEIYNGTTDLGAAIITGSTWTFTASLAQEGQYALHAEATDVAGNRTVTAAQRTIVIDNTAPSVAIASQTLSTDTGSSHSDLMTNSASVTLGGSVSDAGSAAAVQIYDLGETLLGTANITGNSWTFSTTLTGDGRHILYAVATDVAGNRSVTTVERAIMLDTTAPTVAIISQALSTDTGANNTDRITRSTSVTLAGFAFDFNGLGGPVEIYNGTTDLGAATVTGNNWTFATTLARDGQYALHAEATDIAGNRGASAVAPTIVVDNTPPTTSLSAQSNLSTSDATVLYSLAFSEPVTGIVDPSDFTLRTSAGISRAAIMSVSGGGGVPYTIAVATGTGSGTIELDFTPVDIADAAGNIAPSATGPVYLARNVQTQIHANDRAFSGRSSMAPAVRANDRAFSGRSSATAAVHANDLTYSSTASGSNHLIDMPNFEASYADLIRAFGSDQGAMQNWYSTNEPIERRTETFDGLDYIASYNDLINAFASAGSMSAVEDAGARHFITSGFNEGRGTSFNGLDYIASYADLIAAFGANGDAGAYHYIESGHNEGRRASFDGLDYIASYADLIRVFEANEQAGAAHFITSGYREGRTTTFDGLDYIASYNDLINAFASAGSMSAVEDAGARHFITSGFNEGRSTSFNGLDYIASYADLIAAFGANGDAGAYHYIESGHNEGRRASFDGLDYIASYADLIRVFGANEQAGAAHFITSGYREGRTTTFDGLDYIASHNDLINAFASAGSMSAVEDAGARHFITSGFNEGRSTSFNGLDYIASYADLIAAFGANGDAGAYHYIESGHNEGRRASFDGLDYIASYADLISVFGANEQAGAAHFITSGYREGRTTTFDGLDYIAQYADLMMAFGANGDAGASHYINSGFAEGRSTGFNVAAYEQAHPDLLGRYSSNDAFLTAYIDTYRTTGQLLT
jgi:hypothetical protein